MQSARDVMKSRAAGTTHPRRWYPSSGELVPSGAERLLVVEARAAVEKENRRARLWSALRRMWTRR